MKSSALRSCSNCEGVMTFQKFVIMGGNYSASPWSLRAAPGCADAAPLGGGLGDGARIPGPVRARLAAAAGVRRAVGQPAPRADDSWPMITNLVVKTHQKSSRPAEARGNRVISLIAVAIREMTPLSFWYEDLRSQPAGDPGPAPV